MTAKQAEPLVKTADGLLRGRVLQSIRGGTYFSFQGVPYAQPPVGPLRFQAPRQVKPWTGEREALKEGPSSPAFVMGTNHYVENSSEDCLYLNVYTNQLSEGNFSAKKPVLVWIHGGGFYSGSGNTDVYGPDYFMLKDVVLITINYRLDALGFLSLQNAECPGNNGLKDQVEALRWVRRNVQAFGGDSENVTIFGESAGGACVQYLMLSPQTRGLFHRAITQSGSVLNPWALSYHPIECAFKLGELLGFKTDDKKKLLDFLMTVPPKALVEKSHKVLPEIQPDIYYLNPAFAPVLESHSADAFISEPLEKLVAEGKLHDVPYILGVNTLEGLAICGQKGLQPMNTKEEYERLLPIHWKLKKGSPLAESILEKIKLQYFPNGYDAKQCIDVLSVLYFLAGNNYVLQGLANATGRKSKTYFYQFTYEGGLSLFKGLLGFHVKGTFHGDEIPYLFYSNLTKPEIKPGSDDERTMNTLCQLWTDFAAFGDPTPQTQLWPQYTGKDRAYLDIGETLQPKKNLDKKQYDFWDDIFALIRKASSSKL